MKITAFTVGEFQENAYLVVDEAERRGVLVDPGAEGERLVRAAAEAGADLDAIWLTHAHVDHVGGIAAVKRRHDVPVYLHPADLPLYHSAVQHGLGFGIRVDAPPPPERELADGDVLKVGSLAFSVVHVPGHAPGHVMIHGHGVAFVGDCIFAGSVGRVDLPLANGPQLVRSLDRICALPDETVLYPGHGPATTVAREKAENPFLNGLARIVSG